MPFKLGTSGKPKTDIPQPIVEKQAGEEVRSTKVDLEKLYHAVSVQESSKNGVPCANPSHVKAKNCVSIMSWAGTGRRHLRPFKTFDEGKAEFKSLWLRVYGDHFPTKADAKKYSGNDKACIWLRTVEIQYFGSSKQRCNDNVKSKNYGSFL